jgi:hypothetical protein
VDVVHITIGDPEPYEGDGRPGGIEFDYSLEDDRPVGAKVIGFKRHGWLGRLDELSAILGGHLQLPPAMIHDAVQRKVTG